MKIKQFATIAFLVFVLVGNTVPKTNATVVKKLSEEEMVSNAQTILIGTCTSIRSEWNEERTKIFTYITISPHNFLKNDVMPQEIVIKQLGGEVGEIGMHVEGTSVFEEGEEVLLFLKQGRKGFQRTIGLSQGKFSIQTDPVTQRKILIKKRLKRIRSFDGKMEKKIVVIKSDKKTFLNDFINRVQNTLQYKNNR